ncbi:hypothetical protein [Francisella persica]|nr:hypothetical protein [Francisella persica]
MLGGKKEKVNIFYDYETLGSTSILMKDSKCSEEINVTTIDIFV